MASEDERKITNAAADDDEAEDVTAAMLDLSTRKKKKKKASDTKKTTADNTNTNSTEDDTHNHTHSETAVDSSEQQALVDAADAAQEAQGTLNGASDVGHRQTAAEYTYEELLERVVALLQANNPDLVDKKRTRIKPPQMQTISSRKTMWVNFQEICSMMQRDPQHVYTFFMAELGTEGSMDGNQRLIIRKCWRRQAGDLVCVCVCVCARAFAVITSIHY
jgi:translation initiation factor 2 subunit 2